MQIQPPTSTILAAAIHKISNIGGQVFEKSLLPAGWITGRRTLDWPTQIRPKIQLVDRMFAERI
jgi:hypothetical protein